RVIGVRFAVHGLTTEASPIIPSAVLVFFFHAEDGIRHRNVTGVQTCALPISARQYTQPGCPAGCLIMNSAAGPATSTPEVETAQIGRASRRERGKKSAVTGRSARKRNTSKTRPSGTSRDEYTPINRSQKSVET